MHSLTSPGGKGDLPPPLPPFSWMSSIPVLHAHVMSLSSRRLALLGVRSSSLLPTTSCLGLLRLCWRVGAKSRHWSFNVLTLRRLPRKRAGLICLHVRENEAGLLMISGCLKVRQTFWLDSVFGLEYYFLTLDWVKWDVIGISTNASFSRELRNKPFQGGCSLLLRHWSHCVTCSVVLFFFD